MRPLFLPALLIGCASPFGGLNGDLSGPGDVFDVEGASDSDDAVVSDPSDLPDVTSPDPSVEPSLPVDDVPPELVPPTLRPLTMDEQRAMSNYIDRLKCSLHATSATPRSMFDAVYDIDVDPIHIDDGSELRFDEGADLYTMMGKVVEGPYPLRMYYSPRTDETFVVCNLEIVVGVLDGYVDENLTYQHVSDPRFSVDGSGELGNVMVAFLRESVYCVDYARHYGLDIDATCDHDLPLVPGRAYPASRYEWSPADPDPCNRWGLR